MKHLSDSMMDNDDKKRLAKVNVTTLSYDLDTTKDNNINKEIKDNLMNNGWSFVVPEQKVVRYGGIPTVNNNAETPKTTAWKADVSPLDAINDFSTAIEAYNASHLKDKPAKFGRGNAFAVCDKEYESLRIE